MVEYQAQSWKRRVVSRVLASRARRSKPHARPAEDRDSGWYCRISRILNENLESLVRARLPVPLRAWLDKPAPSRISPDLDERIREGAQPSPVLSFPRIEWRRPMGLEECPYAHRWVVDFSAFALRLHSWHRGDDARSFHDHPNWMMILCLWGGYTDVSPAGRDRLRAGSIRFRPADHKHMVDVDPGGAVTFLITGPHVRRWGFWVNGKLVKRDKYFAELGHHPCDEAGTPVRMRPDGSRIT